MSDRELCGYCMRTSPAKMYCKRHMPKATITRVQMYTAEQVAQAELAAEEQVLSDLEKTIEVSSIMDLEQFISNFIASKRYIRQSLQLKKENAKLDP